MLRAVEEAKKTALVRGRRPDRGGVHRREGRRAAAPEHGDRPGRIRGPDPARSWPRRWTASTQALTDAKLQANQIDKVVLVGGATRTPLVHRPARGAAGPAGPRRDRARPGRGHGGGRPGGPDRRASTSARSWSTSPRTRSASRRSASCTGSPSRHRFAPIIHRNTPLPATRTEIYSHRLRRPEGGRDPRLPGRERGHRGTTRWSASS